MAYSVSARVWQLLSGPVSVVLVAARLSPEAQGFYYTFGSIIALQWFIELGLAHAVLAAASHEWAMLEMSADGSVTGSDAARGRLGGLLHFGVTWYGAAAAVFVVVVGMAGFLFFGSSAGTVQVDWRGPWAVAVGLNGMLLATLPVITVLEGCGQVREVSRVRALAGVVSSLVLWAGLASGAGLWALALAAAPLVARDAYLIAVRYRRFLGSAWASRGGSIGAWLRELWPMQWRLAVVSLAAFFAHALFNPVLFRYAGPVAAGRMGMTLQLSSALQMLAGSWVQVRAPLFGVLAARGDFTALDALWRRVVLVSVTVFVAGSTAALALLAVLEAAGVRLAERLLPVPLVALLLLATLWLLIVQAMGTYLRSFKREALVVPATVMGLVAGIAIWQAGKAYGAAGAIGAYLGAAMLIALPWTWYVWRRSRRTWHAEARPG